MPHAFNSLPELDEPFAGPEAGVEPVVRPMPAAVRRPADRRGPLRPGRLISTRSRLKGEALARTFAGVDAVVVAALSWLACGLANPTGIWPSPVATVMPFAFGAVFLVLGLHAVGAHGFRSRESMVVHLARVSGAFGLTAVLLAAALAVTRSADAVWQMEAVWFCLAFASLYLLHVWWWISVRRLRRSGRLTPNVVVVGATANAERLIANALASREVAVLGVFDDRKSRAPDSIKGVPMLGDTTTLIGHRIMPYVDRVVITVTSSAQARVRAMVDRLRVLPNEITLFVDLGGEPGHAAVLDRLADIPLARISGARIDDRRAFVKRLQDVTIGALALVLAAPIMAAVALAIRLDSPGPVFFRQRRQGFNNEEIVIWKFRSMRHDMRDERSERQVSAGDPRVTRVGRFIRQTSLDELPQILNVLAGEMSLVGPRPHAPAMKTGNVESARLVAEYAHRHRMKPGMTGWAAIKGSRGPVDTPERVKRRVALDIEYIERQSFWLDLYIMAMTLPCLLGDRRAAR
ncbi:MAG TPA: exopolysaccharide biosynthesis polyprenyl glycosylphosphotransferase [Caulobacteraceae bacterium]|jgi:Undecaprenyl-phosphate glucose phosphotransferase|nr:exopolysaccharide biosynthesis polyprenyl glycosylphosphotransferase [Caulobacteraceae bacterium]